MMVRSLSSSTPVPANNHRRLPLILQANPRICEKSCKPNHATVKNYTSQLTQLWKSMKITHSDYNSYPTDWLTNIISWLILLKNYCQNTCTESKKCVTLHRFNQEPPFEAQASASVSVAPAWAAWQSGNGSANIDTGWSWLSLLFSGCSSARFRVRVWGACGRKFESCHPDWE